MFPCLTALELPISVMQKLEDSLKGVPLDDLQTASQALTEAYRSDQNSKDLFQDSLLRGAYLGARLPATFACLKAVLSSVNPTSCRSLLDLGAGPATAYGVLQSLGFCINESVCYEQSEPLFKAGVALWPKADLEGQEKHPTLKLVTSPLTSVTELPKADLVVMSFFLGELPESLQETLLEKAWKACEKTLVILEPGTPNRFERMRAYREQYGIQ